MSMAPIVSSQHLTASATPSYKSVSHSTCLHGIDCSFHEKASNAVVARLLGCLVNEHLADAYLVESSALPPSFMECIGSREHAAISFRHWLRVSNPSATGQKSSTFWAPLRHMPLPALPKDEAAGCNARSCDSGRVGLLDPEDLAFPVIEILPDGHKVVVRGARQIMHQLARWHPHIADTATMEQMTLEMENSAIHQEIAYIRCLQAHRHPLVLGTTSAIEWEQSIVEGHATHPMHKSRFAVPPTLPIAPYKDLRFPTIHFFAVPRSRMTIRGPFDELISPLLQGCIDAINWSSETVVPVHELQLPNIHAKFPHARQLSFTQPARAQVSLRTVLVEALPHLNFKLSLGIKVSSCMRTISPWSAHIGPSFTPIAERVIEDQTLLQLCNELASVVAAHPDPDCAKHFSCIIRQDAQFIAEPRGEYVVVCAALAERVSSEEGTEFVVNSILRLQTQEQRSCFFRHYARRFLQAFASALYKYGMSFEAHLQNVLARFRRKSGGNSVALPAEDNGSTGWELVGFTVRDLGGIKVHQPTLRTATAGLQVDVWNEEAGVLARDLEEVHDVAFHTMVQCHLHRMARALGVHHDGSGWGVVRHELHALLPADCPTRHLWLDKRTAHYKAFITMKLSGVYRDYLYTDVPNLLVYRTGTAGTVW